MGIRAAAEGREVRRGAVREGRRLLRWDDGGRDLRLPALARVPSPLASSLQLPSPPLHQRMEKFVEAKVRKCPLFLGRCSINAQIIDQWCLARNLFEMRYFFIFVPVVKKQTNFSRSFLGKATLSSAHHGGWNWFHYWRRWGFQHLPYAVFGPAQKRLRGAQRTTMQNSGDVNFQNWKTWSCQGKCPSRYVCVDFDHLLYITAHEISILKTLK